MRRTRRRKSTRKRRMRTTKYDSITQNIIETSYQATTGSVTLVHSFFGNSPGEYVINFGTKNFSTNYSRLSEEIWRIYSEIFLCNGLNRLFKLYQMMFKKLLFGNTIFGGNYVLEFRTSRKSCDFSPQENAGNERNNFGETKWEIAYEGEETEFQKLGLDSATEYEFRVRVNNS